VVKHRSRTARVPRRTVLAPATRLFPAAEKSLTAKGTHGRGKVKYPCDNFSRELQINSNGGVFLADASPYDNGSELS
jgi:hypothetical protein